MKAALIIMTILGCDDGVTQCHYISTADGAWQTVAQCDAASQKLLPTLSNDQNYPTVVAVCETAGENQTAMAEPETGPDAVAVPLDTVATAEKAKPAAVGEPSLPRRALAFITGALPDRARLRDAVATPVHYVADGYSWVARKFTD